MKCSQCKEKLAEYIEGNLSDETDEWIKEHLLNCQSCKESYAEELLEYKAFKAAFSTNEVKFESIMPKVINAIDKNKYSRGRKIIKKRYMGAVAAALFICIAISPLAIRYINNGMGLKSASSEGARSMDGRAPMVQSTSENEEEKFSLDIPAEASNDETDKGSRKGNDNAGIDIAKNTHNGEVKVSPNANYVSLYSMVEIDNDTNINFNTAYIPASNGVYKATIEGKGAYAAEEGVGVIYVENTIDSRVHEFRLKNEEVQQTPIDINWYDDTHLIVVQGSAYGTLVNGVDIVVINIETGEQMLIATASGTKRYRSVTRDGNSLVIEITKYVDEAMGESVDELQRVENYQLGDIIE